MNDLMHSIQKLRTDWETMAREPLTVERLKGGYLAIGSEIATLRLFKKYHDCKQARQFYSDNLSSFCFVLDTPNLDFDDTGKMIFVERT